MGTQKSESIFLYFSDSERIKVTGKDNQRQGLSGHSAGPLHAELHTRSDLSVVTDIIMTSTGLLARSGHSYK